MTIDHGGKRIYTGYWKNEYNTDGYPFIVWRHTMPRIPDEYLNSSIYLYPSVKDAEDGVGYGGSGFLLGVLSKVFPGRGQVYAVTNSHVIREGAPVVRLSTSQGETEIIECEMSDWRHHPNSDDVAACPISTQIKDGQVVAPFDSKYVLTEKIVDDYAIGPGDEIFMVGRFIGHDGKQRNLPSIRFGNLSMMPYEPLYNPDTGLNQESFLVETRSLSGYSGSPVIVYSSPPHPRPDHKGESPTELWRYLLGIDWCHLAIHKEVLESDKKTAISENWWVETNSGMAGVVPAWKIMELIDTWESVIEKEERKEKEERPNAPILDSTDGRGISKLEFERDLRKVSRKTKK